MKTTKIILFLFLCFSLKATAEPPAWELVSMNPPRGNILDVTSDSNSKLFTSGYSGIFSSSDDGETWVHLIDEIATNICVVNDVLFSRRILKINGGYYWGLYKSTDNGTTWFEIKENWNKDLIITKLVLNNNILYAFYKNNNGDLKIFISVDKSDSWKLVCELEKDKKINYFLDYFIFDSTIFVFAYPKENGGTILLISSDYGKSWLMNNYQISLYNIIKKENELLLSTSNGIQESNDNGKTWNVKWLENERVYSFDVTNDLKNIYANIFSATSTSDSPLGIKYSNDSGNTWKLTESFKDILPLYSYINLIKCLNNQTFAFPLALGNYRTNNFGNTWEEKNNGFSGGSPSDMTFSLSGKILISSWGIFQSIDQGKSFEYLGLKFQPLTYLVINKENTIFIGQSGGQNGIFRSTDNGRSWENRGNFIVVTGIDLNSKGEIFIAPGYRSTDNGETWLDFGIEASYIAVNDEDHVFAFITGHIFRSTDDGVTWDKIAETEVDPTYIEWGGRIIFNNKTQTAAYYDMMTTDNGRTWIKQSDNGYSFGTTGSSHFAIDSTYNWVFAGSSIKRSRDNGKSWQRMDTTGLKHKEYQTIGCSPDGHIYVFGSTGGLYRSRDRFVSVEEQMKITYNPNELLSSDIYEIEVREWDLYGRDNSIKIYNTLGKCVLTDEFESDLVLNGGTKQVNISSLPPGVYFIRYLWVKKSFVRVE